MVVEQPEKEINFGKINIHLINSDYTDLKLNAMYFTVYWSMIIMCTLHMNRVFIQV